MAVAVDIILVILLVDFVSGLLHWLEDSYGRPEWPLTGWLVTIPNIIHHHRPTYFTKHSWLRSAQVLIVLGSAILVSAWLLDLLSWQVLLFVAIGMNANEIHKWNHLPRSRRNSFVVLLQELRLLQTPEHHARHHGGTKDSHYCVITNVLNPVLERLGFWRLLEGAITRFFQASKRPDRSVIRRYTRQPSHLRRVVKSYL